MKHPMQPQTETENKVIRFVENPLVTWLIDQLPDRMNTIAHEFAMNKDGKYCADDYDQILQLIGYSVSGIPYRDPEKYKITDENKDSDNHFESEYKGLKDQLRPIISELFNIHEDDLK